MSLERKMIKRFSKIITGYLKNEDGVAATEAALTLPVLMVLMAGVYDIGQAIVINHKTVIAAQIMGDLIARTQVVDLAELEDIATAGAMALAPYDEDNLGYDIVSFSFDDDGNAIEEWRVTEGMLENQTAITRAEVLAEDDEGLIVVTTTFNYVPVFSRHFTRTIELNEVALLRGRRGAVVNCSDCP